MRRDYRAELEELLPLMDDDLKLEVLALMREVQDQGLQRLQGTNPKLTA